MKKSTVYAGLAVLAVVLYQRHQSQKAAERAAAARNISSVMAGRL